MSYLSRSSPCLIVDTKMSYLSGVSASDWVHARLASLFQRRALASEQVLLATGSRRERR